MKALSPVPDTWAQVAIVISQLQSVIDARMQNWKRAITGCWGEVHNAMLFEQIISFLENDKMNGASVHPSNESY